MPWTKRLIFCHLGRREVKKLGLGGERVRWLKGGIVGMTVDQPRSGIEKETFLRVKLLGLEIESWWLKLAFRGRLLLLTVWPAKLTKTVLVDGLFLKDPGGGGEALSVP